MFPERLIGAVIFEDICLAVEKESRGQRFQSSLLTAVGNCSQLHRAKDCRDGMSVTSCIFSMPFLIFRIRNQLLPVWAVFFNLPLHCMY